MVRASVVCAAILLTLLLTGCGVRTVTEPTASAEPPASAAGGDGSDADALMARAATLAARTTDLEAQLWEGRLMAALIATDPAAARTELSAAGALLEEMRANEKAIAALLGQVAGLDVSEELRTYAVQQKEIADLRLLSMAGVGGLLDRVETSLRENGGLSQADIEKLFAALEPSGPDDPLASLEEKGQASRVYFNESGLPDRYYMNNGLGEAYDTPAGQTEEQAGAFPFADGIRFEGPMVAEEAPPRKLWGSFATSVAEAMQTQRSAFEGEGWTVSVGAADETGGTMTARNAFWQATLTFEKAGGERGKVVVRMSEL
jgi:hypothetical protein